MASDSKATTNNNNTSSGKGQADTWESHVHPHGEFNELVPNRLWNITGKLPNGINRNMTVYKMDDGNLWCHSVIALNDAGMSKLLSFGNPTVFVAPNGQHTIDTIVWQKKFPECKLICPRSIKEKLQEKGARIDGFGDEVMEKDYGIKAHLPGGLKTSGAFGLGGELTYELKLNDDAVAFIFTDVLNNEITNTGLKKFLLGSSFGCPRLIKWSCLTNKNLFKEWLIKIANMNITVLTLAHGPAITENIGEKLKEIAKNL